MYKKTFLVISSMSILITTSYAISNADEGNAYEKACVSCHQYQPAKLENMFMIYLKTYGVEINFKLSLKEFLQKPTEEKSLIGNKFLKNFSVKDPTDLNETELDDAINIYWDMYNPKDNLK